MISSCYVLVVLAHGFEEIEAITPIDLLRRAGVTVTLASLDSRLEVVGRNGITLLADAPIDVTCARAYDLILLPGGPGASTLAADPRVADLVVAQVKRGGWVAAICAAPLVLHNVGLLEGRRFTAHPSVVDEIGPIVPDQDVVVDPPFITSRGAGTAVDFGLEIVARLVSEDAAKAVRESICA